MRHGWVCLTCLLFACAPPGADDTDGAPDATLDGTAAIDPDDGIPPDAAAPDPDDGLPAPDRGVGPGPDDDAAELYRRHCAACHGPAREGGVGPALDMLAGYEHDALTTRIDLTMPPPDPAACQGDCAAKIAAWLLAGGEAAVDCTEAPPELLPRRLRLLTRREYDNAVRDLLWPAADANPAACGEITFRFPAAIEPAARTVHVAGTFNGWAPTRAAGGLALAYDAASASWQGTHVIGEGTHRYKFVADEARWHADPANDWTENDGFGGQNSVVELRCAAAVAPGGRPSRRLPPETRPEGYAFDNHADSARVETVTLEAYVEAAEDLAAAASCDDCLALLRRAFRRAPTADESARYRALLDGPDGQRRFLAALLSSPHFLYRTELGEPQGDGTWRLTGPETASALAFFLWSAPPDDALLTAGERGELATADGIERHARRLLEDPRARATLGAFAEQWLGVEPLPLAVRADAALDGATRDALLAATRRFVTEVVFDGPHDFRGLLLAAHTPVNEAIARLYGIEGIAGPELRTVPAPPGRAAGVLGLGSVLATHAHADQSSPIRRGLFVRRRLLCQELPPAPPNAGGVPDVDPRATTRERFRQHTDDPFCHACHRYIDDVGFGFEGFDAIGRARATENGQPIDDRGDMNDVEGLGTATRAPYQGLPALAAILADSHAARRCFVTQVRRFALGAGEDSECAAEALAQGFAADGEDIRALLVRVARDPAFTVRRAEVE
ncbi:MAG: DUF1588 domain-containing protein [Myxococcales bacterium]|nr:DUF1588 domain-containing protein [Myxococcales bacterium]